MGRESRPGEGGGEGVSAASTMPSQQFISEKACTESAATQHAGDLV